MAFKIAGLLGRAMRGSQVKRAREQAQTILGQIGQDETISDITREELTGQLQTQIGALSGMTGKSLESDVFSARGGVEQVAATLGRAREGQGAFAGRQLQKKRATAVADRPGRRQTILTR